MMGTTNFDYKNEIRYLDIFRGRKVDGILLIGSMHEKIITYLNQAQKINEAPFVLLDTFVDYPEFDCIMIDNDYGIDAAIKHLKDRGHKRIGFISEEISSKYRLPGFKKALENNGLEFAETFVKVGKERFELGGYLRMKELLQQEIVPTALFASYDSMAIGAMKAAQELNVRIPEDISIVGFDNVREAKYLAVPLTTVSPPVNEMVDKGVEILIDKIKEEDKGTKQQIQFKPELIIRKTTLSI